MKKQYRKSDLNIIDDGNIKLITNQHPSLLNCKLVVSTSENVELEYQIVGENLTNLKLKKYEKCQVIYRLTQVVTNQLQRLSFTLCPENVYIQLDGTPIICERAISNKSKTVREADILNQLVALAGYLFENIDYYELLEVNSAQLESSKYLKGITEIVSLGQLNQYFAKLAEQEMTKLHDSQVIISNSKFKALTGNKLRYRVSLLISIILIAVLGLYIIPFKNDEIKLYEAYENKDSTTILDLVKNINQNRMTKSEKLIASKAVINDQVELNDQQKKNITSKLNQKTNQEVLDYWIYIGKGDYDAANNCAIALSDADMQIYALLMLIGQAQNDSELESTERKELIDGYEQQVDDLQTKKNEANGVSNE